MLTWRLTAILVVIFAFIISYRATVTEYILHQPTTMTKSLASKNKEYWNNASQHVFKDKWVHDLQNQIAEFLTGNTEWLGMNSNSKETKMMDYACGNGIVSRAVHHLFSKCVGVDVSSGMLDKYRATATELGLDESRMLAVQGDLLAPIVKPTVPPLSEDELNGFDLVAISMALHHVEDLELTTKRLAERLRPGGVLLIIDWATQNISSSNNRPGHHSSKATDSKHPAAHTISHDSFSQDKIFSLFEQAGCGEPRFVLADRLSSVPGARGGQMQLFWARAIKL